MTDEEILRGIVAVAREHVELKGGLRAEMRLVEDLALDSLQALTLAVEVENRFQVCLDGAESAGIHTVGDLIAAVRRQLG